METMYYIGLDVHKKTDQLLREGRRWRCLCRRFDTLSWRAHEGSSKVLDGYQFGPVPRFEEAAERCGLHRTYYSGIERGVRNVSIVNIEKVAKGSKKNLPELFSRV